MRTPARTGPKTCAKGVSQGESQGRAKGGGVRGMDLAQPAGLKARRLSAR